MFFIQYTGTFGFLARNLTLSLTVSVSVLFSNVGLGPWIQLRPALLRVLSLVHTFSCPLEFCARRRLQKKTPNQNLMMVWRSEILGLCFQKASHMHLRFTYAHMLQATKDIDKALFGPPERPSCLSGNAFVHPDVQCPPKRRGRKPGAKKTTKEEPEERVTSRPSAAACGFSTVGMSDKEVMEKINKPKRSRKDKKGDEDDQKNLEEPKTLPEKKTKKTRGRKKDAEADMETNRKRKSGDGFGGNGSSDTHDCGTPDTVEKKPRNTRKSSGSKRAVEDANDPAPKSKAKRTKATACETPAHDVCEDAADTAPKSKPKRSKAKACEGGPPPPPPPGTPATVDTSDDPKKRASRKSSAYHCARLKAKKEGASKEEQIAAAKAVSCLNSGCRC